MIVSSSVKKVSSFELVVDDISYLMYLPNWQSDYIQSYIAQKKAPYEINMLRDMQSRVSSSDLILDIGANVGNHTLFMAAVTQCHVYAFEPNNSLANAIEYSSQLNHLADRIKVSSIALGEKSAKGKFRQHNPSNLGAQSIVLSTNTNDELMVETLDSIHFPSSVKAIKLDVEGMEFAVLKGGEKLIARDLPLIYVECQTEVEFVDIKRWLTERDYVLWDTFNATPTHLFIPRNQIDFPKPFEQLLHLATCRNYKFNAQIQRFRSQLDNLVKEVCVDQAETSELRHKLSSTNDKYLKLSDENSRLITQLANEKRKYKRLSKLFDRVERSFEQISAQKELLHQQYDMLLQQVLHSSEKATESNEHPLPIPKRNLLLIKRGLIRFFKWCSFYIRLNKFNRIKSKSIQSLKDKQTDTKDKFVQPEALLIKDKTADITPLLLSKDSKFSDKRVACILDGFTYQCYQPECDLLQLTPDNWAADIETFNPELLFVESAWQGKDGLWDTQIRQVSDTLKAILCWCNCRQIKTIFWNKEDPVHFTTFINAARLFDYVFTTDIDCIYQYKVALGHSRVYFLPFACQPVMHHPLEVYARKHAISFAGAYYAHYPERVKYLRQFTKTIADVLPFEIYDRNYGDNGLNHINYQFPQEYHQHIVGTLPFDEIDIAYKGYDFALNLSSIKSSHSMFARRVFELLGSNTITISNFAKGICNFFGSIVITNDSGQKSVSALQSITQSQDDLDKRKLLGLRKVMKDHTYQNRLAYIFSKVEQSNTINISPHFIVFSVINNQEELSAVLSQVSRQREVTVYLYLITNNQLSMKIINDHSERLGIKFKLLLAKDFDDRMLSELIEPDCWCAVFSSVDYYGPNYLLDIALASRYSKAKVIGKAEFYHYDNNQYLLSNKGLSYQRVLRLPIRSSAFSYEIAQNWQAKNWCDEMISDGYYRDELQLSIDRFNYCKNIGVVNDHDYQSLVATVDDLNIDQGLDFHKILEVAEGINPSTSFYQDSRSLSIDFFCEIIESKVNPKIKHQVTDYGLDIISRLPKKSECCLYSPRLLAVDKLRSMVGEQNKLPFYLSVTPRLLVSLIAIFYNTRHKRVDVQICQPNSNYTITIPEDGSFVTFGLCIKGPGQATIHKLVFEHQKNHPILSTTLSKTLVLTNHYPAYGELYRNAFVHSRVSSYQEKDIPVDIFRLRRNVSITWHEFEGVEVMTGDQSALRDLLTQGCYRHILVHFINEEMWEVLKDFVDDMFITVWVHGVDIQTYKRRKFNFTRWRDIRAAKRRSKALVKFWHNLLHPMPGNLKLVFVSEFLAQTSMKDLDISIPDDRYHVIHNPINTTRFNYQVKPPEQRKKLLSIRPYASPTYANDLTVAALLYLSREPWFHQLDICLVGDGILFDETISPLLNFSNITIEKRFLMQDEIAALHKSYGIFLCPSRMDTHGVSRDEAMSSGLVPITNAVGAIPEFTSDDCAIVVPPEDSRAIAEGIKRLFFDPGLFCQMSGNAAKRVRHQSAQCRIINQELDLFSQLES